MADGVPHTNVEVGLVLKPHRDGRWKKASHSASPTNDSPAAAVADKSPALGGARVGAYIIPFSILPGYEHDNQNKDTAWLR